ncbi:hypothetical protein Dsin_016196 [Dipteronia sinensis]|uniref:Transposase MuDR plant domain-containing protein n=1 Tax=Dipteronia sinensis TaxID=43782 RepID=A0AAE0E5R7_9ROSI|nr:hypothetical protein Dsin_016196 [Dipteronia sinensis]
MPYIPVAPDVEASVSTPPRFMGDIPNLDFSGFEQDLFGDNEGDLHYEGDNEDQAGLGDESSDDGSLGMRALAVVPKVLEEVCEDTDEYQNLFEGYQSKSDDEYCSDSGDEVFDAILARVIKSNPFKKLEGFNFNKVKNDKNRLTWACMANGCSWRIHASNVDDDRTMQVKIYKNEHICHPIYNSKDTRAKWITGKFQAFVKSNPGIHAAAYIHLLDKTSTFQRMFVSFEAQRKGFFEGCRHFLGIDGCHLKGPYVGILLSAIALDTNSGLHPLAYCICEGETFLSWSWFLEQLYFS